MLQVAATALGAWPLYELALRQMAALLSPADRSKIWLWEPVRQAAQPVALALAAAYLLAPQLQSAVLTEFHAIPLAVPDPVGAVGCRCRALGAVCRGRGADGAGQGGGRVAVGGAGAVGAVAALAGTQAGGASRRGERANPPPRALGARRDAGVAGLVLCDDLRHCAGARRADLRRGAERLLRPLRCVGRFARGHLQELLHAAPCGVADRDRTGAAGVSVQARHALRLCNAAGAGGRAAVAAGAAGDLPAYPRVLRRVPKRQSPSIWRRGHGGAAVARLARRTDRASGHSSFARVRQRR